eukprot:5333107-Pyramimonas_sp.AAC.1
MRGSSPVSLVANRRRHPAQISAIFAGQSLRKDAGRCVVSHSRGVTSPTMRLHEYAAIPRDSA